MFLKKSRERNMEGDLALMTFKRANLPRRFAVLKEVFQIHTKI